MQVIKDDYCAKDDCPSFGVPEDAKEGMAWVQGAVDPADPSKETRVYMPVDVLRRIAAKL